MTTCLWFDMITFKVIVIVNLLLGTGELCNHGTQYPGQSRSILINKLNKYIIEKAKYIFVEFCLIKNHWCMLENITNNRKVTSIHVKGERKTTSMGSRWDVSVTNPLIPLIPP